MKSLMLNGLLWAIAAAVAYFIIRQWYVWGAFVILMMFDFVRTSARRYQFVTVEDGVIKFRSLIPLKKVVAISTDNLGDLMIKRANAFSWLIVSGENRVVRLQIHVSELRALQERLMQMGLPVKKV